MHQAISAQSIMIDFADSTGLSDMSREPRRYLWTDAFAVCNYLELYRQTGEQNFLQMALKPGVPVLRTKLLFRLPEQRSSQWQRTAAAEFTSLLRRGVIDPLSWPIGIFNRRRLPD